MHKTNKKQIEKPVEINKTLFKNTTVYAILFFMLLSLTAPLISSFITSGTTYSSNQTIISSGGTNISSASYKTTAAIAQVVIGNINSSNYQSYLGFFYSFGNNAPTYSLNSTNSTLAGADIEHSLKWEDDIGLSGYIFSFHNGSNTTECVGSLDCLQYLTDVTCNNCSQCNWTEGAGEQIITYDDCNSAPSLNATTFAFQGSAGDATGDGEKYYIDASVTAEMTIYSSGTFNKVRISASPELDLLDGRGHHISIGTGALCQQDVFNTNTGYAAANGYIFGIKDQDTNPNIVLYRLDNCVEAQLDTIAMRPAYGSKQNFTFVTNSSGVFVFINETLILSSSDTTYSDGGYITISTGGGISNRGSWYVYDVWNISEGSSSCSAIDGGTCSACAAGECDTNCSTGGCSLNTIEFVNDSWVPMAGTLNWSNVTKTINSTVGATIKWCVYANDTSGNWNSTSCVNPFSYVTNSSNTAPTINLTKPEDGNTTVHDKTPTFEWNATDLDSDLLNYTIYIYNSSDFSYLTISANTTVMNYTPAAELELDIPYYWKVMVYDQTVYINSSVLNFTIESYKAITLVDNTSSFGTMSLGDINDTTNNNPIPLRVRNDGNVFVNLTLNATSLWSSTSASLGTDYYQFKADNVTAEIGAFSWSSSTTNWANMLSSQTSIIKELNYNNSIDEAEIELRVEVPLDEPPDSKTSTILVETE